MGNKLAAVTDVVFFPPSLEPLMNKKEAAGLLGIKVGTLSDWVWQKRIPYVKIGKRVMFEPEALRRFIERGRVAAMERVQ
jgi:excisionase family DNA binding protein